MAEQDFITGPFGSAVPVASPVAPEPGFPGTGTPLQDGPRIPLTDATVAGDRGFAESRQRRDERAQFMDSTMLEGIGAAIMSWDTTRLVKRIARPAFEEERGEQFKQFEYLENLPLALDEDEHEFFTEIAKGRKSAEYAVGVIEDRRLAMRVAGEHPVAGIATQFVDPLWLAVPPAIRVGRVAGPAGRVVSAGSAAAVGGGVVAAGEGPVSDMDIALNMVLGGTVGAAFYKPGKGLVNADPEFDAVQKAGREVADPISTAQAPTAVQPADVPDPGFLREFGTVFSEAAIERARSSHVVMMTPEEYRALAFPRERTQADLTPEQQLNLAEGKRAPIRAAIGKGGLDDIPSLRLDGGKVVGHDGRHRADVLEENMYDSIPVRIEGDVPAAGARITSETGEATVSISAPLRSSMPARVERPPELAPNAVRSDPVAVVAAVDKALVQQSKAAGLGEKLMWNMHKTMAGFGPTGRKIANMLYDDNTNLSRTSIESQREAILSDLRHTQFEYEDILRQSMAEQGFGWLKMMNPMTSRSAYAAQNAMEKQVHREMLRREQASRMGGELRTDVVPPHIAAMADKLDELHKRALAEMKRAGVEGADAIKEQAGYMTRKWNSAMIDDVISRFERQGLDRKAAHAKVVDLVAMSLARGSRMDNATSKQIGGAIVDRAIRKGYFEDSLFNPAAGEGQMKELRDILRESGMAPVEIERAMNVLRQASDEQGKAGFMKHRMDLDYDSRVQVGNEQVSIIDLIDSRVTSIVDQYTQRIATNAAFARSGLPKRSDVTRMRDELMQNTPVNQREQARELFDDTIAYYRGEPSGGKMNEKLRLMQTYGRSIALAWSGLWQLTEFATVLGAYGMRKSLKYAAQEMPGFKQLMSPDKATATSLQNILSNHSAQSLRLRPYLSRYADGYEMDTTSALQLSSQTIGQSVPIANAMKYVHSAQARIVGNLILDRVQMAAKGDPKARAALQKYGLEAPVMDKLNAEIKAKGFDVDMWDDAVWEATRPAFAKMMDESVLKGRLGDTPAFAAFDQTGKFIFMYRSFVLTAHNKIVAGKLERDGAGALGLILLYQFPLALAAVQARATVMGEGQLSTEDLIKKGVGQMGGLGLFSEPFKWVTGESNAWGASGLIPIDRGIKMFQSAANADAEKGASTALTMLPVISAVPFVRGMSEQIKE